MIAQSYGNVYVASVSMGANPQQVVRALLEAQAWDGPSLVIAYSTCIAHGIDMATSMTHQAQAVATGYWPLYRFRPSDQEHSVPLHLDSKAPTGHVSEYMAGEARFGMLARSNPKRADELAKLLQEDGDERWRYYSQLAGLERVLPSDHEEGSGAPGDAGAAASPSTGAGPRSAGTHSAGTHSAGPQQGGPHAGGPENAGSNPAGKGE